MHKIHFFNSCIYLFLLFLRKWMIFVEFRTWIKSSGLHIIKWRKFAPFNDIFKTRQNSIYFLQKECQMEFACFKISVSYCTLTDQPTHTKHTHHFFIVKVIYSKIRLSTYMYLYICISLKLINEKRCLSVPIKVIQHLIFLLENN